MVFGTIFMVHVVLDVVCTEFRNIQHFCADCIRLSTPYLATWTIWLKSKTTFKYCTLFDVPDDLDQMIADRLHNW